MRLPFEVAFQIIENVYRGSSNMNELINDRARNGGSALANKTDFLLAVYQLEEVGLLFRYRSNDGIRYIRTEEGETFYAHYQKVNQEDWPKFL
ncbi:DUF3116 family protein [Listeria kieliensis]|uniref:Uncharacterized protein n=1 Tax=Listeria kieliensis TaxID=1621700 RepID=A0A3D8TVB5_9LIST|nr:DUF3116 family protein [Listeria kieliensis]RDX02958.1 hypothetical protein UR08_05535 [Listeria kieliensis]